jgi:hypothetical protein
MSKTYFSDEFNVNVTEKFPRATDADDSTTGCETEDERAHTLNNRRLSRKLRESRSWIHDHQSGKAHVASSWIK